MLSTIQIWYKKTHETYKGSTNFVGQTTSTFLIVSDYIIWNAPWLYKKLCFGGLTYFGSYDPKKSNTWSSSGSHCTNSLRVFGYL